MKRYDAYQKVNLPWLSTIPSHWELNRNKVFLHESKETVGENSKDFTLLSLTLNGIIPRDVASGKGKFPSDFSTYKVIQPNDMVFCLFDIDETPRTVGLSAHHGMLTGAYDVFHVTGINSKYLLYYYLSLDNAKAMRPLYKGLRKTIGIDTFLGTKMPVPPRAEQEQIVRYLDWQVSKINRLIAAKQHQIELLEQKKMRSIQMAFCQNMAHHSAEDLLGTIKEWLPEAWTSPLLGQAISYIEQGWSPNAGDYVDSPDQWHVLTLSAVKHGLFINTACKPIDINATVPANLELQDGDLLFTRSNTRNLVGDVCLVRNAKPRTIFSDLIYRLVVKSEYALSRYLMYYLLSPFARIQIERAAKGSSGTMPKLSHADIRRICLVLPPLDTQESICNELDAMTGAIDAAIDKIKTQINHILELRTRLISDVVTGQIDVRDIEVPEYEFVEEPTEEHEDEQEGETDEE